MWGGLVDRTGSRDRRLADPTIGRTCSFSCLGQQRIGMGKHLVDMWRRIVCFGRRVVCNRGVIRRLRLGYCALPGP